MDKQEKAMQIAKEDEADFIQKMPDWNGQEVWLIGYGDPNGEVICTGYPEYVVFKGENFSVLEPQDALKYMKYLDEMYGSDGDDRSYIESEPIKVA